MNGTSQGKTSCVVCVCVFFVFPRNRTHERVPRFTDPEVQPDYPEKKHEYLIARSQLTWSGVRWDSVPFNF